MKEVNVTELRQHLPEYLAAAGRGRRILVKSRGRIIAELVPPRRPEDAVAAARALLRDSVVRFDEPTAPAVDPAEWSVLA